jgi:antitoxin component YwqK of YwqJK toxin-antitoxin module
MTRVNHDELEDGDDGLTRWRAEVFSGVGFELFPNGRVRSEVTYAEGIQSGPTREWYETGVLKTEDMYANGNRHGTSREWYENGKPLRDARYEHSIRVREQTWDRQGNLVIDYQLAKDSPQYGTLELLRRRSG